MAQPATNTAATLSGLFKKVYSKEVADAIPDFAIVQKLVPFNKAELIGDSYNIAVCLSDEQGFSYGGSTATAYALNDAVAMQLQQAVVPGFEMTLQSSIAYGAVSRAQNRGEQAVEQAVQLLVERMKSSCAKRLELQFLYGGSGIGQMSAISGTGTTRAITLSDATWSAGIWAGLENANLDFYVGSTKQNTNAAVVLVSVDVANKKINVSGNSSDLTALDSAVTPDIYFYGAYGAEATGLQKILSNTGSLFGIDASTYNLWQAQTYDCGSAKLSLGKINSAVGLAVGRGLMEDVTVFVGPDSWADLNTDLAAQRQFDGSYKSKQGENGVESINFHGSNGAIKVVCHPMMKAGYAMIIPVDQLIRVGSSDISFRGEGPSGQEEYFFQNQSINAWTCRAYSDQGICLELPAHAVLMTGITP